MDAITLSNLTAAAATVMSLDATAEDRIAAKPVVISAIVEIVAASKCGLNATAIRKKLKSLGVTLPRSTVASLASRAVHQGLLEDREAIGVSYVETTYHAKKEQQ